MLKTLNIYSSFLIIGALATLLHFAILILFVEVFDISSPIASVCGYATSSVFNYTANYYVTFKSKKNHLRAAFMFVIMVCISLNITYFCMLLLTTGFESNYVFAQLLTTFLVLIFNFLFSKIVVF